MFKTNNIKFDIFKFYYHHNANLIEKYQLPQFSSNGCLANPYGKKILLREIEELQKQKNPFKIVFCGKPMEELNHFDNIIYYPNHYGRYEEEKFNG